MSLATLSRQVAKMKATIARQTQGRPPLLDRLARSPAAVMVEAGMQPDPWQRRLLSSCWTRALLCCSRQVGKSQIAGALALRTALLEPRSLVLILSPTLRQSGELFRDKLLPIWRGLGSPLALGEPTQLSLTLANGSRILSLPMNEGGIRGYSGVRLLIVDEAARVSDSLYRAVRPMLAVSRGRLIAMSSPFGKRGWFYESWSGSERWERVSIRADQCPRISAEFLAEERACLGARWYAQEYECSFEELVGAVFAQADIDAALSGDVEPLYAGA